MIPRLGLLLLVFIASCRCSYNPFAALAVDDQSSKKGVQVKKVKSSPSPATQPVIGGAVKTYKQTSFQAKPEHKAPLICDKGFKTVATKKAANTPAPKKTYTPYTPKAQSFQEKQYAPPPKQTYSVLSYATTGLPKNTMPSMVKPTGPSSPLKLNTIQPKKPVIADEQLKRMPYVYDIIDQNEYKTMKNQVDPRDLAYLYIMAGERVMQNIFYPLAVELGIVDKLGNLETFANIVRKTDKIEQIFQTDTNIATKAQFELAVEVYRRRLRVAHPSKYSLKKPAKESISTQIRALLDAQSINGMEISKTTNTALHKIKTTHYSGIESFKPVEASPNRPSSFPDGKLVNQSLALLMVQDALNLEGLVDIRNQLAHDGGDSQVMYESMVQHLFQGEKDMKDFLMLNAVYTPQDNYFECL